MHERSNPLRAALLSALALVACAEGDEFRIADEPGEPLRLEYRFDGDCGWEEIGLQLGERVTGVEVAPRGGAGASTPHLVWREVDGAEHAGALSLAGETTVYLHAPAGPLAVQLEPVPGLPAATGLVVLARGHALPVVARDPRLLHRRWTGKTEPQEGTEPVALEVEAWWSPAARAASAEVRLAGIAPTHTQMRTTRPGFEGTRLKTLEIRADDVQVAARVPESPDAALTGQLLRQGQLPATIILAPRPEPR